MRLSVIIPCFNERRTLPSIIERVQAATDPATEIIVVDDGSTDGSPTVLRDLASAQVKIVRHERNQGKGAAINTGFRHASGDIVLVQDADFEYSPADYPSLLGPILSGEADVVYGSRFMGGRPHRVVFFWHMVGNRFLTLLSNVFTNINLTDMETGYKVFRRDVLEGLSIEERRFGFEPEITAKLAQRQCRFFEVGISYYGRTYAEGKKVGWRDGFRAIYVIVKYNLWRREPAIATAPDLETNASDKRVPVHISRA
jgi:glycosyltransferase involved in cell wall biosynthesis